MEKGVGVEQGHPLTLNKAEMCVWGLKADWGRWKHLLKHNGQTITMAMQQSQNQINNIIYHATEKWNGTNMRLHRHAGGVRGQEEVAVSILLYIEIVFIRHVIVLKLGQNIPSIPPHAFYLRLPDSKEFNTISWKSDIFVVNRSIELSVSFSSGQVFMDSTACRSSMLWGLQVHYRV